MEKIITYENLRKFTYSNDKICKQPIRGIALSFFGLGCVKMYSGEIDEGRYFAEKGIVYLAPYYNPWSWMNRQAVAYTDELVSCIMDHYKLDESTPIVSTGSSMGGQSALVYMVYAARTPVACVVNCPVCDLPFHFTEREDLPSTLYSAFFNEPGSMEQAMRTASPVHLVDKMPDADYYVFHCDADTLVNKARHSDVFVPKMQKNHRITYHSVPGRDHCDLTEDMKKLFYSYIVKSVEDNCAPKA